ncbi:MAG: hypothetical protein JSV24_06735 [Bacteroidales bacterium]|nr:MAG: hypothetical protein JSV24_06735 [Bacteroidales bacterium]
MKKYSIIITKYFSLCLIVILFLALGGCKSSPSKEETAKNKNLFEPLVKDAIEEEVEEFISPLPSSFEVTEMLNDIGISYILGISNSVDNVDRYFTERSKALNLGVYSADLSYASTYQMKQEVMLILEAAKKLTDDLEISTTFNETLVEEIEKNLDNKDALVDIITDSFNDTYNFLNKNDKGGLSLLIVAGSWVEALFLTTHVSANVYHNYEIVKIIYDQKVSLEKLISLMEGFNEDPYLKDFLEEIAPLREIYDTIDETLTEDQVNQISATVEALREKIIG